MVHVVAVVKKGAGFCCIDGLQAVGDGVFQMAS
jgi:hypothetical protein